MAVSQICSWGGLGWVILFVFKWNLCFETRQAKLYCISRQEHELTPLQKVTERVLIKKLNPCKIFLAHIVREQPTGFHIYSLLSPMLQVNPMLFSFETHRKDRCQYLILHHQGFVGKTWATQLHYYSSGSLFSSPFRAEQDAEKEKPSAHL